MKNTALMFLALTLLSMPCTGQSSLSLVGNGRWGSESYPFFTDSYGNEVTLSTGSGVSGGFEFGYDFTRMFNLALGASYNFSNISARANNADGSFRAMGLYLTPSFMFPARPDPGIKILIGAGPDFYAFGTIKIEAEEAGGENMTFKYKPAFGYHAQILFQLRFDNESFISIGPKYYRVSYSYREKGSTHFSTIREINNPNGSGFGLYVGIIQKF